MTALNYCARCRVPVDWTDVGVTWTRQSDTGITHFACLTIDERVSGLVRTLAGWHEQGEWARVVATAYALIDAELSAAGVELEATEGLPVEERALLLAAWAELRRGVAVHRSTFEQVADVSGGAC